MTLNTPSTVTGDRAASGNDLHGNLRQMIAVLEAERQALAGMQADTLISVSREKEGLCDCLADITSQDVDEDARALAQTAKSLNDANRRVRNLLAANVTNRLESLGAERHSYIANTITG